MKRKSMYGILCLLLFLPAMACRSTEAAAMQPEQTTSAVITVAITAEPLPTTEPFVTPEPLIQDEWYLRRSESIEHYVRAYANLNSEQAILDRVARMMIDPNQKRIAFTFDDGPKSEITDAILDVCEEYNVRATFFIKGANIAGHDAELKRMLSLGCEIGNHTWDHPDLQTLTSEQIYNQISQVNDTIKQLYGYSIRVFRPPYIRYGKKGSDTRNAILDVMQKYEMAVVNHTRSTHDTHSDYTENMIYQRCVDLYDESNHALHNSIILCHDRSIATANAFRRAVPELLEQGYQLVTVSELLYCSDDGFHVGWIYSKAD